MLTGKFGCFDKQKNILLVETREQRFLGSNKCTKPDFERHLGLVLVNELVRLLIWMSPKPVLIYKG